MQRFNRSSLALLACAVVGWALVLAFVALHLAAPSDGARLAGAAETGGLRVAPFAAYGLQEHDVVLAVDGQSIEFLKLALGDLSRPAPQWAFGQTVRYTVLRDGEQRVVPVTLGPYPLGAVWATDWGAIVVAIVIQLTMGFVFLKRPNEPIARAIFLTSAALVSASTWSIGLTIADIAGKVGFWLYAVSSTGVFMLVWVGALHSILLFPNPLPLLARHRWIVPALYAVPYLVFAAVTLVLAAPNAMQWQQTLGRAIGFLQAVYGLAALAAAFRSFRAARDPVSRAQVRWVATGFVFTFFCAFTLGMLPEIVLGYALLSWNTLALTGLTFPLAFAVAILRYRLFDIDIILNRTLVYGALSLIVIGLYIGIVGGMNALFQSNNLALSLVVTALVAVIVHPVRDRIQRGANRLMYGERDDPYAVLSGLGQRLEATLAPDSVLPAIVETVAQALKLPHAAISFGEAGSEDVVAAYGSPQPHILSLPLRYQHDLIGHLHVARRSPEETFTPAEQRLLNDIARQTGVAAHNVRLAADLQKSREHLVTAREEERRRLRRDLHDGLGPKLAGQTLKLEAALDLLTDDAETARALLKETLVESQSVVAEIRRLVYGLRPPALDELGLLPALREQAAQYQFKGLQVIVCAPEALPPLPAAVEVAAFRIVQEALTNVTRHAQAKTCTLSLIMSGDLEIEIGDDGRGLPVGVHAGVGLTSMRERAEEIGGSCVIEAGENGGVRVAARLPISNL